jgi:phage shock protein PspC (stress-responsive transcriptional regulator)
MHNDITSAPHVKRLERSSSDRMLTGVAGGLGRYFDLNASVFRLGFVVLTLLGGVGLLVYLAAVLVIPAEDEEQSIAGQVLAERRDRPWPVVGLGLAGVALLLLISRGTVAVGAGWSVALVAGLGILWLSRSQRRPRRLLIAALTLLTIAVVTTVIAAVVALTTLNVHLGDGIGESTYAPSSMASVQPSYDLGIGNLTVDLSQIDTARTHRVKAHVGIGELRIVLPRDAAVRVVAHAKYGQVSVLEREHDGRDVTVRSGAGLFVIDANVGAGQIDVVRAA